MSVEDMIKLQARRGDGLGQTNETHSNQDNEILNKRLENLENAVKELSDAVSYLNRNLKDIKPERIEKFNNEWDKGIEKVQSGFEYFDKQIRLASVSVENRILIAGEKTWKEYAKEGVMIAIFFVSLTMALQYGILDKYFGKNGDLYKKITTVENKLNMVHYNQTMPGTSFSPWDWDSFIDAWNNQDKYIKEQREQADVGGSTATP